MGHCAVKRVDVQGIAVGRELKNRRRPVPCYYCVIRQGYDKEEGFGVDINNRSGKRRFRLSLRQESRKSVATLHLLFNKGNNYDRTLPNKGTYPTNLPLIVLQKQPPRYYQQPR